MYSFEMSELIKYWLWFMIALSIHQYGHIKALLLMKDKRYINSPKNSINPFYHIPVISMFLGLLIGFMWSYSIEYKSKAKSQDVRRNQEIFFGLSGVLYNLIAWIVITLGTSMLVFIAGKIMDNSVLEFIAVHLRELGSVNLFMGLLNLLPIKGLDGYTFIDYCFKKQKKDTLVKKIYDFATYGVVGIVLASGLINYKMPIVEMYIRFNRLFG